jgi:hypothetical protein
MADLAKKVLKWGEKKGEEKAIDWGRENLIGKVCTWTFKSEENKNRCTATNKLIDAAQNGAAAVVACPAAAATDAATPASGGLLAPAGVVTTATCAYNAAEFGDNAYAGVSQMVTGKDTPTYKDQVQEYTLKKAEEAGAWVKKRWDKWVADTAYEIQSSDFRAAQKAFPGLTAEEYNAAQDAQTNFDTWGEP